MQRTYSLDSEQPCIQLPRKQGLSQGHLLNESFKQLALLLKHYLTLRETLHHDF